MSLSPPLPCRKSVLVLGDGYVARNTLSSLVERHGNKVDVVAGVADPSTYSPMDGVRAIKADLWDKVGLTQTLKEGGNFCRVFLVLPGHADRVQMGWNGLEAVRDAGILQVVLVSVLTADTPSEFKPLEDNIQTLGKMELPPSQSSSPSTSPNASPTGPAKPVLVPAPATANPSTSVRIQRRNVLQGWYPMKVKLVQISIPNLDPAARCGKPSAALLDPKEHDNGLAELQRAFVGPYEHKGPPAHNPSPMTAGLLNNLQRDVALRKELLQAEAVRKANAAAATLTAQQVIQATAVTRPPTLPLPPLAATQASHVVTPNNFIFSDLIQALQEQRRALEQPRGQVEQPHWSQWL